MTELRKKRKKTAQKPEKYKFFFLKIYIFFYNYCDYTIITIIVLNLGVIPYLLNNNIYYHFLNKNFFKT
jgi:hypothetical protein